MTGLLLAMLVLGAHHKPAHAHPKPKARPVALAPELSGPLLQPVETSTPLRLQAPPGWSVEVEAPRREALSTIAVLRPDCPSGPETSVTVQLDQTARSAAQLLALRYPRARISKLRGWSCAVDEPSGEAMCAGTVKGLPGIAATTFFSADPAMFQVLGGSELAAGVAAGLSWKGGAASRLGAWRRDATQVAMNSCR